MYLIHDGWYNVVRVQVFGPNKPPAKWCWRLRLVLSVGDRLALTHQQLPHALRLPTQHLYFWRHGVLKKETQSGMPSAGLAITPYKTKNVYVPMDTHRLQTPPPQRTSVSRARAACGCVRVCAHCARACELYARARARAVRAHCTCALYLLTVRARCTRTVRADCTQKVCAKICCVFFKICCLLLKICCGLSKSAMIFDTCGPHVRWPYGTGRARTRTVCTRARAHDLYARSARALYVRTARAHCTYRTRTVRPDCTQKVCAKICCVLFKICCVFSKSVVFSSKSAVFFCTYGPRVRCPYGTARAGARRVYVCATRARAKTARARTVRARCTYRMREPYSRTVRKKCVPNFAVLFSKSDACVFFSNLLRFFFQICGVLFARTVVAVRYGTRACGAHDVRRARARVYGVQRTRAVYVCGARSARVWRA